MKLWILRHGQAHAMAASDSDRALTDDGRAEVTVMARQLAGQQLDVILSSPYTRARQTAAIVREQIGFPRAISTAAWLTPDDNPAQVMDYLAERTEASLLIVSHQPLASQLISLLVEGHRRGHYPMPTAGLACIEMDFVATGLGILHSLTSPVSAAG
ncbi:MAG TPA: phosphohistidine phosphatase SixA [Pseudomonas xinjiangensis]|uniref:Phosphohistidine phosphatase SixA n=2 Tax=root TaxID=1 RepID=A0A7V1BQ64_9GAMM|nr:phosphohistidine phosphatase SixA [Halopseudomonas xinjiangensis]HEC49415.1 phosphohistidine phosphatase SixA [Halopseudomonas xinjiangensis]